MDVAPNRGFSRSGNLLVSLKFIFDRPVLPWQRKIENFNTKLAKTQLIREMEPTMLHQMGCFRGQAIKQCHGNGNVKNFTGNLS